MYVDVLRKRVESFPILVDKRELNIAIEGQINIDVSLRLLIIMCVGRYLLGTRPKNSHVRISVIWNDQSILS